MRPIDADALLKDLKDYRIYDANTYYGFSCAVDAIKEAPTVDAVEVVRCADCKFYGEVGDCKIHEFDGRFGVGYFCADGMRKEQDDGKTD